MAVHARLLGPGSYEPDQALTGVNPRTSLTALSGNQTITTGTTLTDRDITGRVIVQTGATVILQNCWIRGDSSLTSEHGVVDCTHSSVADVRLINCTVWPSTPTKYMTGVLGHHYQAKRCKIGNCVDGLGVYNTAGGQGAAATGVIVESNWVGAHGWWATAPNQSDGSHSDGIQIQGGAGTIIRWNKFHSYFDTSIGESPWGRNSDSSYRALSSVMVSPNVGAVTGLQVYGNWFAGGEINNNVTASGIGTDNVGSWTNNQFYNDQFYSTHTLDFLSTCTYVATGNVYTTGGAVTVREV